MKHDNEALKAAALKAGMIDLDGLKLADMSKVTLEPNGEVTGADQLMVGLKERWPDLFAKHARNMTPEEAAARLAELKRESEKFKPLDLSKTAKEMSSVERKKILGRMQEAIRMMESQSIKPAYQIRLLERFVFYAPDRGVHLWREWPEGATVTDADAIELLTKLGAPVEVVRD